MADVYVDERLPSSSLGDGVYAVRIPSRLTTHSGLTSSAITLMGPYSNLLEYI